MGPGRGQIEGRREEGRRRGVIIIPSSGGSFSCVERLISVERVFAATVIENADLLPIRQDLVRDQERILPNGSRTA